MRKVYLLITAAMLLIGSSSAWAANSGTASLNGGDPMGIADAISSWKSNGGTLQLLEDCEYDVPGYDISLPDSKVCTLDLKGLSLQINVSDDWGVAFNVGMDRTLIINDSEGGGSLIETATSSLSRDARLISASNFANVTINGGSFSCNATNPNGKNCYVVEMNVSGSAGTISINNGVFENGFGSTRPHTIYGGKFKVKPADTAAAEGYVFMQNADGYYELVNGSYFAFIGGTGYSDVNAFNAALSEVESSPTEVTILAGKDVVIPENKYVTLKQYASSQENGTITNNGSVKFAVNQTWDSGIFVNEGSGSMTISSGIFESTLYGTLVPSIATLAEGCSAYIYYKDNDYKQVLNNDDIVATVGSGDALKVFTTLNTAISYSSASNPAVVIKNNSVLTGPTISDGSDKYLDLNGKTIEQTYRAKISHGSLTIQGEGVINNTVTAEDNTAFWLVGSTSTTATDYSVLTIGTGVTLNVPYGSCIGVLDNDESKLSYGVVVNVNGTLTSTYSYLLYINGNVRGMESKAPKFNIANSASIEAGCADGCACIYAAGYGEWTIGAATLRANTPIYAKAGVVTINGATIEACGAYAEPQPYGNGFYSTGDAIVFDSKNGYAGNMQLSITDATITSANGYAVHEVMTDRQESQTLVMQVAGGKFKGERGSIELTENFNQSTPTRWAMNSITSGKYSYAPNEVADGYIVVLNTDADKNEFPYKVVYDELTPATIVEITENTTVNDVVTIAENNGLVIKSGVTYTVKGLVIGTGAGSKSKVTVEAGAKLIVGEYGIVNYSANQLVLEADKRNGTAILRFDGTTSNKQPYAKVELYMYAHQENSINVWQHIGVPTAEAPEQIAKTAPYMFNTWDVNKGWQAASQSDVNSPWVGYNSSTNMGSEGSKLTFTGRLVGNANAEFVLAPNAYSCVANSYTDYTAINDFISLFTEGETDGTVWVYGIDANGIVDFAKYNSSSFDFKPDPGFAPMQAFFIKNNTAAEIHKSVPYGTMGTTREAVANEFNGGIISIIGGGEKAELQIVEKEGLSDEMDYGYDSEQFATGTIQIYVKQGDKKLAAIGTNNINGKEIEIVTKSATEYTLKFEYLKGNAFKLKDLASGADVEVTEGGTYTFSAAANSTILRFKLGEGEVAANEADVESVSIWVAENVLNIAGAAEGDSIEIINLAGIKVLSATATGEAVQSISLSGIASGAYIVKAGAATVKVIK